MFFHALSTALQLIWDSSSTNGLPKGAASAVLGLRRATAATINKVISLMRFVFSLIDLI
jgi:hypothetical protein